LTRFDWREASVRAESVLSEPPAIARIQRPVLRGQRFARFVLPLELCKSFNQLGRSGTASQGWLLGKLKKDAFTLMLTQAGGVPWRTPLTGRPQVVCVRFSSTEPDHDNGWSKNPVDRLRVGHNGLGIIVDDKPRHIELSTRWEPAKRGEGLVYIEIRSET
jgi:hypothetical protein